MLSIFVLLIVSFLWQEHQALDEKSESPMTTDDPIVHLSFGFQFKKVLWFRVFMTRTVLDNWWSDGV